MKIRFRIHDRAAYPAGAVLEVEEVPDVLRESLSDGADGVPVANVTLRSPKGVGYANLWLEEPTAQGLANELARIEALRTKRLEREGSV